MPQCFAHVETYGTAISEFLKDSLREKFLARTEILD